MGLVVVIIIIIIIINTLRYAGDLETLFAAPVTEVQVESGWMTFTAEAVKRL